MKFEDLGLDPKLLQALSEAGYESPTPIQEAAIPAALTGQDVLGIAQTGTGKTASFTLPMIHRLAKGRARARMPRTLVLAPTRELAAQVAENFEKYGKFHKLTMALLIGGVSFGDQDAKLMRGVDVLIATPGRLIDQFERGKLLLTGIEVMVVDEADRMLDMGFIPDIERIFKLTPMTHQTLFFSATMPPEIQRITDTFLHNPARIEVSRPAQTAETIEQNILRIPTKNDSVKRHALRTLVEDDKVNNGIVFCNRKTTVDIVAKSLQKYGINARPIHGDLPQSFRMETLDKFREGETKFLIASDVAARGLDIPNVSHVFNFDVPIHADDYVHRIGRTGRAGRNGVTYMLVGPNDDKPYQAILDTIGADAINEISLEDGFFDSAIGIAKEKDSRRRRRPDAKKPSKRRSHREDDATKTNQQTDDLQHADDLKDDSTAASAQPVVDSSRRSQSKRGKSSRQNEATSQSSKNPPNKTVGMGEHVPAFMLR